MICIYCHNPVILSIGIQVMNKTILVVDDDATIRDILERYLRREGFAVRTTADGQTALHMVHAEKPDLIVLDLMLPEIDGWELCRRLRAETTIPILMLTARGEEYERILGLGLGADDYITKPFSPGEVVARIKAIFRRIDMIRAVAPPREEIIRVGAMIIASTRLRSVLGGLPMAI